MAFVIVDDKKIYYEEYGSRDNCVFARWTGRKLSYIFLSS